MKPIQLLLLAVAPLSAMTIASSAVPVSGSGSWFNSLGDTGGTVTASGNDGEDSVSFSYFISCGGPFVGAGVGEGCANEWPLGLGAEVDGVWSSQFSVAVSDGSGYLDIYGASGALEASAALVGWVTDVGEWQSAPGTWQGTFAISPTNPDPSNQGNQSTVVPEPNSGMLVIGGAGLMCWLAEVRNRR